MTQPRPNVLVVMYDQLAPMLLGCYGNRCGRCTMSPAPIVMIRRGDLKFVHCLSTPTSCTTSLPTRTNG